MRDKLRKLYDKWAASKGGTFDNYGIFEAGFVYGTTRAVEIAKSHKFPSAGPAIAKEIELARDEQSDF